MWDQMLLGIQTAFTLQNMLFAGLGCFVGTIIGMLPGLGPMSVVAIMIPVSIQIGDPSTTLILLHRLISKGSIYGFPCCQSNHIRKVRLILVINRQEISICAIRVFWCYTESTIVII